jgi:hypothetical protein
MMTICSSTLFQVTQAAQAPGAPAAVPQPRPEATEEELRGAQATFYENQGTYYDAKKDAATKNQQLQERLASVPGQFEQEGIKQTVGLGFRGLERMLSYGFDETRKWAFGLSEEELLLKEMQKLDKEAKEEQLKGQKISNEASTIAQESKAKEHALLDKQELNYDIDAADKIAARAPGAFNNPQVQKRWRELAAKAGIDLPEEPAKDTPAQDDPQKTASTEKKKSLLSKLATPFVFALTTTGDVADFLAGYSVAHITNLDCFKDTFVQTPTFNRMVVIATIAGATYGGYQFYKSRYSDDNDDDVLELD